MPAIRLVPLSEAFADDIDGLLADAGVMRFTRIPDPPSAEFARTWIERYEDGLRQGTRAGFAAITDDGAFAGIALAPAIDREGREVELGYIVAPALRGRGFGAEILGRLTEWAFDELGALRISLMIDVDNPASEGVARRCGYVREGVLRSSHLKQGIRVDVAIWSKLPSDRD